MWPSVSGSLPEHRGLGSVPRAVRVSTLLLSVAEGRSHEWGTRLSVDRHSVRFRLFRCCEQQGTGFREQLLLVLWVRTWRQDHETSRT